MDSDILTPWDVALKFLLQPCPMKMTGSGFLNGWWRQVRNHKILLVQETVVSVVVRRFPRQKANKLKLAKQCGHQASKIKTKSFGMRYSWSDVLCHQSFVTQSTSLGVAKAGNLKLDFMEKSIATLFFWFEYIFRFYRDTKTEKNLLASWTL